MSRRTLVVAFVAGFGVAAALAITVLLALIWLGPQTSVRELQGPIGIKAFNQPPTHGFLGVGFNPDSPQTPVILAVVPGSPAADAGLRANDVITAIADLNGPDLEEFMSRIQQTKPGDLLSLTVRRREENFTVNVRLLSFDELVSLEDQARSHSDRE